MVLTPTLIAAGATLAAAAVAATVSLLVAILSKEQKTSEMRQQWIDALRNDVAELASEYQVLRQAAIIFTPSAMTSASQQEYFDKHYRNAMHFVALDSRIQLRINDNKHTALKVAMEDLRATTADPKFLSIPEEESDAKLDAVVKATKLVLAAEWKRVKRGETAFVWTKRIAVAVIVSAIVSIGLLAYSAIDSYAGTLSAVRSVSIPRPAPSSGDPGPGATGGSAGLVFSATPGVPATSTTAAGGSPAGTGRFGSTPTGFGGR